MKKIYCILIALCVAAVAAAELNPPHRYFEIGADVHAGVSNNWFQVSDFFNETLVIDFTDMAAELNKGLSFDALVDARVNIEMNFGRAFRMDIFTGVYGQGMLNVSQDILRFIAEGNASGDHSISGTLGTDVSVYAEAGVELKSFIKKLGISFTPTVFIPVAYVPRVDATATVTTGADGTIHASGSADVAVYSVVPLNNPAFTDFGSYMADAGLDFTVAAEYAVLPSLDVGLELAHIPAVEAGMRNKMTVSARADYTVYPVLSSTLDKTDYYTGSYKVGDPVYETLDSPFKISRPMELTASAVWRPFGEWFDVNGSAGYVFGENKHFSFTAGAGFHLVKMCKLGGHLLDFSLTTGYENRIWTQQAELGLNLRVLELVFTVSSRAPEFLASFTGTGLGAGVGVRIGF